MVKKNKSEYFALFLAEFSAKGKERGEGFSVSNLNKLSGDEYRDAENILINSIDEIRSVKALAEIQSRKAIPLMQALLKKAEGPYKAAIVYALWKLGVMDTANVESFFVEMLMGEEEYLQIQILPYLGTFKSQRVIRALSSLIREAKSKEVITNAFMILIQDVCSFVAAKSFFESTYRRLLLDIISENAELRKKALDILDQDVQTCFNKMNR